jgi:hypothetical protein
MVWRQQCTTIGSPAMSASGLRGSLVAPIREGITIKGLAISASFPSYLHVFIWFRGYSLPE